MTTATAAAVDAEPRRIDEALNAPSWLTFAGSYRIRYEHLDNPFRIASAESDRLLVERFLFDLHMEGERFYAGLEIEDSRAQLGEARPPLGTDDVNALEPLRGYLGVKLANLFSPGDRLDLALGRMTIDAGSRRFVARNGFRNTINAFTGLQARWDGTGDASLQAFYVLPVRRLPSVPARLVDNDVKLDDESTDARFWGVVATRRHLFGELQGELFAFGLHEHDSPARPSADRDLYTPGIRLLRAPAPRSWDFEVEAALQFGTSRQSLLPADTDDLDHRAGYAHVNLGRSFEGTWQPRLVLQYDYASGDRTPADDENNRYDTLFGSRRADFGPTGIYGALARSNISSPGLRVDARPGARTALSAGYRAVWLANRRDALTTAGLRDPTGASGAFVGQQLEFRVQHRAVPDILALELGGAFLVDGEFLREAPGAPAGGDSFYWYLQAELGF